MAVEKEYTGRSRSLRVLRAIVQSPFIYTLKRLAEKYQVDESTIKKDIKAYRDAGFSIKPDEQHRYGFTVDRALDNLKSLLVFSPKEENLLISALQQYKSNEVDIEKLLKKMARIYDVSKMHNTFDKNFLTKMDLLEKAIREQKVVVLKDYPSTNSGSVRDRRLEVFHLSAEDDVVHAFDLEIKKIRHFKISRISTLEITSAGWAHIGSHQSQPTDCFRIHDVQQIPIHIRISVGGYNALLESYPVARAYLKPASDALNQYDLQCKVNHRFYGLSNFILGNYDSIVAILDPDELIDHIKMKAQAVLDKKF